jgi:hypothetical protein
LSAAGDSTLVALTGGYHAAFLAGAAFSLVAGVLAAALLPAAAPSEAAAAEPAPAAEG